MSVKRWTVAQPDGDLAANLAEECEIHPFLALLLTTRGVTNLEEATDFLVNGEIGDDVFAFADMDAAVERIQRAIDSYERIAVFGDYDADGVTATALLYDFLAKREADVVYYIPQREGEGYGLHRDSVEKLKEMGAKLLITVDNGIAALEEAAYAAELGMDVVITDHHQPQEALPQAVAVVDPHRPDCGSACKDYAGVGVAFKLICALDGDADQMMEEYGDLVALGTLADVMQLRGENRTLVRRGLQVMNERRRPGLAKLMEVAGVGDKRVTASTAVFTLAPRINAAGPDGQPRNGGQAAADRRWGGGRGAGGGHPAAQRRAAGGGGGDTRRGAGTPEAAAGTAGGADFGAGRGQLASGRGGDHRLSSDGKIRQALHRAVGAGRGGQGLGTQPARLLPVRRADGLQRGADRLRRAFAGGGGDAGGGADRRIPRSRQRLRDGGVPPDAGAGAARGFPHAAVPNRCGEAGSAGGAGALRNGKSRAGLRPVPDAAGQYCAGGRGQAPAAVPVPGGDGCGGHEVSHHAGRFPPCPAEKR